METSTVPHEEYSEPSTYVRGYHWLPQEDSPPSSSRHKIPREPYPGVVQSPPPYTGPGPQSSPYAPAPQSFNAQQSSNNVVVVNQPSPQPAMIVEEQVDPPNDHLLFTICTFVVCCLLGNWAALLCLIPALFLSLAANNANNNRNSASAAQLATISIRCSICAYIQFLTTYIIGAVFLTVMFTIGLGFIGISAHPNL